MTPKNFTTLWVAAALFATSCVAPNDEAVELTDALAPITDEANDTLFDMRLLDGFAPLSPAEVEVWVTDLGGTTTAMPFALVDNDGDSALSAGDTLVVSEPPVNVVGTSDVGADFSVGLMEALGSSRYRSVFDGVWTAD